MPNLRVPALFLVFTLAACGAPADRYLVEPSAPPEPIALRIASLEVGEVVVPAYAEASEILKESETGALEVVDSAEWADGSARAVTAALARSLDLRTRADVAAEPWPLTEPAAARLEVRIESVVARADGTFQLSGQFAVASPEGRIREFLDRFDISVALDGEGPAAIARANGRALDMLADQIALRLRR
ncbi:PqiC family protein [Ostreiculturibacter nitratireducens]|uniref:PqiC family protein n=1 Tax=Ostreiculturibacter nitratireducens TaxID=3075226 RepID=UPI0031B5F77C